MADILSPEKRALLMSRIDAKNTKPELIVRKYLHALGYRYRLHPKILPGKPDLVLRKHNAVMFIHGCFWHRHPGCKYAYEPKTREQFWKDKFEANAARDVLVTGALRDAGWRVLLVWECAVRTKQARSQNLPLIERWLKSGSRLAEIGQAGITVKSN